MSGYFTGVLGVWTAAMSSNESVWCGKICGTVVTRTGGGEGMVTVTEWSRGCQLNCNGRGVKVMGIGLR